MKCTFSVNIRTFSERLKNCLGRWTVKSFCLFPQVQFFFFYNIFKNVWTFGTSNERKVMWNVGEKRNITNKIILTKNCSDILSKNSSYIFRCIFGEYAARTQNLLKYLSKRLFTFYSNKLSMYKIKRHLHVSLV